MSPCPCINCLIYPVCKAQTKEHINKLHILYSYSYDPGCGYDLYTFILEPKCSLIIKWIDEGNGYKMFKRYTTIYKIFK